MSYPLSESFATAPAPGYTTLLGGMTASYNSEQQAMDISGGTNTESVLRFNEPSHGDFWFDVDIEFLTDPSGRKHLGMWMMTGGGIVDAYRFCHLDGFWKVDRFQAGFRDAENLTGDISDGTKPIASLDGLAPTFSVGQRRVLRCEVICSAYNASGIPLLRLIQFKADGVLMAQIWNTASLGTLIPGVFLYGATARIHAIAGGTPSGLPVLPDSVASLKDMARLQRPLSEMWDREGGYDKQLRTLQTGRMNSYFGGHGVISGTVKEKGQPDKPRVARVQLISENTRTLVAETWSDVTGAYRFEMIDPDQRYTVISYDTPQNGVQMYRAVVADNLKPEMMP